MCAATRDGSLAIFALVRAGRALAEERRVELGAGRAAFSLAADPARPGGVLVGRADRRVVAYDGRELREDDAVRPAGGHTGWVRAVRAYDGALFSCGCNHVRAWRLRDLAELATCTLFTGDVLALAAGPGAVFSSGADGSLRRYSPLLSHLGAVEHAHDARIEALALVGGVIVTGCRDGVLRAWDAATLELLGERRDAHGGRAVHAVEPAGDGRRCVSSGGDGCVRVWDAASLAPVPGPPLLTLAATAARALTTVSLADGSGGSVVVVVGGADGTLAVAPLERGDDVAVR